jgi:predicted amidohydrolase YtcJ
MMSSIRVALGVVLLCWGGVGVLGAEPADVIFQGGKAYTLDPARPWAESVAVSGDEIVYVGDATGVTAFRGPNTRIVDLAGGMLLPGFIDTHIHLPDSLPVVFALQLTPAMSAEEVLAEIARYAKENPDQSPLVGWGFLAKAFGPTGPTAAQLDSVVADRPVIITDEGGHTAWANSAAMKIAGLDRDTPDPVPGAHYYQRYRDGTPTGWLVEPAAVGPVVKALNISSRERLDAAADYFLPLMSSMGITAAFDAGTIDTGEMGMGLLQDRVDKGELPLRVVGSLYVSTSAQLPDAIANVNKLHERHNSEFYEVDTLKISLDGTFEANTAVTIAPYREPEGHIATPFVPYDETMEVVVAAGRQNMNLHIHAIGDGAVRMGLDLAQGLRELVPESTSRITICHIQVVNPADVPRFAALDVIAQTTPSWLEFDVVAQEALGEERFHHLYPLRSILAAGARLTLGSDYPASWIGVNGLSPLFNIEMGVTRQPAGEPDFAVQPLVSERITVAQAIRGYTLDAAYQLEREDQLGSIEVGKQADLVVLDRNLLEIDPYTIHQTRVELTMVNGKFVFERGAEQ